MSGSSKLKHWLLTLLKFILIFIIIFAFAAFIESYFKFKNPEFSKPIPDITGLETYLETEEKKIQGITPNTEKTIKWYQQAGSKTEYAIVYMHGYSATRQETAPLSTKLAEALGANAYFTRLAGHGLADARMADATLKEWKTDSIEAYEIAKRLGDKVIFVSVSTGSTLTTWLIDYLNQLGDHKIVAQVMISPNFESRDMNLYILDWPFGLGVHAAKMITGKQEHYWEPHNKQQDIYWSNQYDMKGLQPLAQILKDFKKVDKTTIQTPSLFIYSTKDTVVSVPAIVSNYKDWGSSIKDLVVYNESGDPSNHVLAGDILSPHSVAPMLAEITDFLSENNIAQVVNAPEAIENTDVEIIGTEEAANTSAN